MNHTLRNLFPTGSTQNNRNNTMFPHQPPPTSNRRDQLRSIATDGTVQYLKHRTSFTRLLGNQRNTQDLYGVYIFMMLYVSFMKKVWLIKNRQGLAISTIATPISWEELSKTICNKSWMWHISSKREPTQNLWSRESAGVC